MDFEEKKKRFIEEAKKRGIKKAVSPLDRFLWKIGFQTTPIAHQTRTQQYFLLLPLSLLLFALAELIWFVVDVRILPQGLYLRFLLYAVFIPAFMLIVFDRRIRQFRHQLPRWHSNPTDEN